MIGIEDSEAPDRLVIKLDPAGPIEVADLTISFAALARLYERHYRSGGQPAPKLYITKLETGSVVAEVAPYIVLLGTAVASMDTAMIVSDFTKRLSRGIRAFSDPAGSIEAPGPKPSNDDAADLREFVRPLAGRKGASLGLKHARFVREDADRRVLAEYVFDEAEINRATINITDILSEGEQVVGLLEHDIPLVESSSILREVTMIFEQASRKPGKEKGRTGDRGVIAEVSSKSLPVYFRKSIQDLKDRMIRSDVNPLTDSAFIVDVHVTRIDGEPKAYNVLDLHAVLPLDPS